MSQPLFGTKPFEDVGDLSDRHKLLSPYHSFRHVLEEYHNNLCCKCLSSCINIIPRQYCVVFMMFFGLFNVYMMRVNLSVAIDPMACEYNWDNSTQGFILSSFFIGYVFRHIV